MNELYPIFLKPENVRFTLIGGGKVGEEKLRFLLKSSPNARVKVISKTFKKEFEALEIGENVRLIKKKYEISDLNHTDIVIAATNNHKTNLKIRAHAKALGKLINVADTPELCDFYLGGIVSKGNVKIAISTGGKSPTLAKRMREFLEEIIPEDISSLSENLNQIRKSLQGDFQDKVKKMNQITKDLIPKK
ncbi:MAG: siroheme synthase [Flavobacteriaceae bacterium]|nr:MAG: siroheme synthase [Flavobacteriaceae bacterium]